VAIAAASRGTPLGDATDQTSYTMVDGGTPANGILLLAFVMESGGAFPIAGLTGYGQTFTLIGRSPNTEVELWACITSGATSTAPVTTDTGSPTGMNLFIVEVTGAYVSGTLLDAFEQQTVGVYVAGAEDITGTATTLSVTLKSPDNSLNRAFSAFGHSTNQGKTPRASWTELADIGHTNPSKALEGQYRSDAHETTASATWATASTVEGIAWTIRDATAPPTATSDAPFFPVVVGA
jgi:hypothetical protein